MSKTQSRKAKGRRAQQEVAERLKQFLGVSDNDIKSLPMGSQGTDIWMSEAVLEKLPLAIEVKNQESIQIWAAIAQAEANAAPGTMPMVAFKRNRTEMHAVMKFEDLLHLLEIYAHVRKG